MSEIARLASDLVQAIQAHQLRLFGVPTGLRDEGALESALGRPINRAGYGEPDLAELTAAYALAIAKNNPFGDGGKRAAMLALVAFLGLNDIDFTADKAEAAVMIRSLAVGEIDEAGRTRGIRDNWPGA